MSSQCGTQRGDGEDESGAEGGDCISGRILDLDGKGVKPSTKEAVRRVSELNQFRVELGDSFEGDIGAMKFIKDEGGILGRCGNGRET